MEYKQFKTEWAGRELKVELGRMAQQANGSVLITYGQTMVLATVAASQEPKEVSYLPLSVYYEEKLYAAGKIKSSRFIKREGQASNEAVLTARMIDRIIRPCFDKKIRNEIQAVVTVLSFDKENDPDVPALLAVSLALGISDIPWPEPVGAVRIGSSLVGEEASQKEWLLNPPYQAREENALDLVVAGKNGRINMIEGEAGEISEDDVLSAISFAQPHIKQIIDFQNKIITEINPAKVSFPIEQADSALLEEMRSWLGEKLEKVLYQPGKSHRMEELGELEKGLIEQLGRGDEEKIKQIKELFEEEIDRLIHKNILEASAGEEKRPDGRKLDEVREIKSQTGILPRAHGSGLFQRGETQALSVCTLGAPGEEQLVDGMEIEEKRRFMHHYNFPPFCTGETGPIRGPGRREIGHGVLAERALLPLIPKKDDFPYIIRVVSEILSSNGSSSMAAVSGSSLALMDAGVPLKRHVSGVAMGLVMSSPEKYKIMTDIQGPEDHHGDMDCKIAGTEKGVTAMQMDVKIEGIPLEILKEVFVQAKKGRRDILKKMSEAIAQYNPEMSPFAPRVISFKINPDRIRNVIGPGGKVINEIIEQTGVKIDIEDDGTVNIASIDEEAGRKALEWVKGLTREVKPGEIFQGKVVKIVDFGAFIEILPGQEGLAHISELADYRVEKVDDILHAGQIVPVKVKGIDEQGKISLTLKNIEEGAGKNKNK